MFFFSRRKEIELVFMTQVDGLVEFAAPQALSKTTPQWWKDTPAYYDLPKDAKWARGDFPHSLKPKKLNKTAKHCYAIQEVFKRGIGFPLWKDMFVCIDQAGKAHSLGPSMGNKLGEQHPDVQYPNLLSAEWVNFKFNSDWIAYTNKPVHFYLNHPFYHWQNPQFQTMPGVIEFYHQHTTNINTVMRRPISPDNKPMAIEHEFNLGDMMAYLMPMTEDKIKVRAEQVTRDEFERARHGHKLFFSSATKHRKNDWGGCPLHPKGGK